MIRSLAVISILLAISACDIVKSHPEAEMYVLKPSIEKAKISAPLAYTLKVTEPSTNPGLNTRRIAVAETKNHLTYYNGVKWAEPLPLTLQMYMVDAIRQSGQFTTVANDLQTVLADYILMLDIQEFTRSGEEVRLRISATLLEAAGNEALATVALDKKGTTSGTASDAVNALNKLLDEATQEMIPLLADAATRHGIPTKERY